MKRASPSKPSYDVLFYLPSVTPLLTQNNGSVAGGAETQIFLVARALARRGVRVCLVAATPPHGELPASFDGVDIVVRPAFRAHQRLVGKLRETWRIGRTIARVDSPVVVVRCAGLEVGISGLAAKLLRRRFVYSSANVVDFDFDGLRFSRRDLALYRFGLRLADEIVVQTDEQARLCELRLGRTPFVIKSIAEPAERLARPEAVLWIGRFVWYKHPLDFVELARSLPDIPFRMVGVTTAETETLAEDVRRAAAEVPNLEILEPRPRAELLDLIDRAGAIVNTSDYEGMPNIFLEGWARGVPALALSHDPDNVIERHGLGEFAHGSRERLVVQARSLWVKRNDSAALAQRCRDYVAQEHSRDVVAVQWAHLVGTGPPPPDSLAMERVAER